MRFSPNLKRILLITTIVLLSCDVTMLFAQTSSATASSTTNPQIQQLQSQVEAQIKALGGSNPPGGQSATGAISNALVGTPNVSAPQAAPAAQPAPAAPASSSLAATPFQPQTPTPPPVFQQNLNNATAAAAQNPTLNPALGQNAQTSQIPPQLAATAAANPQAGPAALSAAAGPGGQPQQQAPSVPVSTSDLNDAAFNSMVQNALPMSPDQIQKLRSMYMASQYAASSTPDTPPRPTATSVFVDLSPGATPPVVRLSQGFVTSMVFVDSTGAPWPIEAYDVGNPNAFNIQWDKSSNTLMVQSTVLYTYGNLAVKLRNLDTPVMITLIPGQKAVDYRVDLRIQGYGPNAKPFQTAGVPSGTSSDLLNILDGVPPPGSQPLTVEGGDCQAWLSGSILYVRTRLTILSPGWVATLSSADGMHAYQMQPTPMILVSQNGQVVQLKVEGF